MAGMPLKDLFRRGPASRADAEGSAALKRGDYATAVRAYEAVVALADTSSIAWFNLGLAHKFLRNWAESARSNRRAAELDPKNEPAFWNCGVAATAIRDWPTARWCWRGIGLDPGEGDGPPDMNVGPSPVRLHDPLDSGEVIWGTRVDPCRLRIDSIPMSESGHRWHDVILHDVVPNGERLYHGQALGVFDELLRMDPSDQPTFEAGVTVPADEDILDVLGRVTDAGFGAEDWSTIRLLCTQCSESSVHGHENAADPAPIRLAVRRFAFAGPKDDLEKVLDGWVAAGPGRGFGPLVESTA
jgi:tetratricopeptide (TPR) repeat protein